MAILWEERMNTLCANVDESQGPGRKDEIGFDGRKIAQTEGKETADPERDKQELFDLRSEVEACRRIIAMHEKEWIEMDRINTVVPAAHNVLKRQKKKLEEEQTLHQSNNGRNSMA
jgi:hypothetical protein